jgi:phosphoribosylaminoimidazole carboxylase PurE protein
MNKVAVVMGSDSDWPIMQKACLLLEQFGISFEAKVLSAHRTPELMLQFARNAKELGFSVIIAGAGGAAHLPGMLASNTILPVVGVPIKLETLDGLDSLLSIVQMPKGVPVATVAINNATNAALLVISMLAIHNDQLAKAYHNYKDAMANESVAKNANLLF